MSDIQPRVFEEQKQEHNPHRGEADAQGTHAKPRGRPAAKEAPVNTPADPRPNVDVKPTGAAPRPIVPLKPQMPSGMSLSALVGKQVNVRDGGYTKTGIFMGADASGYFLWVEKQQDKIEFMPWSTSQGFSIPDGQY